MAPKKLVLNDISWVAVKGKLAFKLTFIQNSTASFQGAHRLAEDYKLLFTQTKSTVYSLGKR